MLPKISIIIPTYNHCEDLLKPCLESIIKHTDLSNVEVIVVANGCIDGTKDYVNGLGEPFKLIWMDEAAGYTKATNAGIKASTGEFVVLLNNDTILLDQRKNIWIDVLLDWFLKDERVGITGPMKTLCPQAKRDFLIFFCVMIRKKLFDEIGLLDEEFSPGYGEDTDFCAKLENSGYKIVQVLPTDKYYGPNQMLGEFPIYHIGNVTFKNWVGGEELLRKNNEILRQRYVVGQPDIERAKTCDGFINDMELRWLGKEAKKRKLVIEIGSWHGKSSRAIGDNLIDGGVLYCVDTWKGSEVEKDTNHQSAKWKDGDHAFYEFLQNNIDLVQAGKIIPLRMTSKNAADFFKEKNIKADMIFIDAGHEYKEVCQDIDAWRDVISDNGIFCGHDFNGWAGVNQAVSEKLLTFGVGIGTTIWYCSKQDINFGRPIIYDCFPFFNELDLLEVRFNELWDVVDRFVITEATLTHGGKPKPMYFLENLKRFEKYLSKVTHIPVDQYPALDSWSIERHQRDSLVRGLAGCKNNDIIIISDADEIPKAEAVRNYKSENGLSAFSQDLYYYSLNCKSKEKWDWARILPFSIFRGMSPCAVRYVPNYDRDTQLIHDGGWHFSYLSTIDGIIEKIGASAHQEYNRPEWKDRDRVEQLVKEGKDLFDRPIEYDFVPIDDSYPKYILDNMEKFKKYAR